MFCSGGHVPAGSPPLPRGPCWNPKRPLFSVGASGAMPTIAGRGFAWPATAFGPTHEVVIAAIFAHLSARCPRTTTALSRRLHLLQALETPMACAGDSRRRTRGPGPRGGERCLPRRSVSLRGAGPPSPRGRANGNLRLRLLPQNRRPPGPPSPSVSRDTGGRSRKVPFSRPGSHLQELCGLPPPCVDVPGVVHDELLPLLLRLNLAVLKGTGRLSVETPVPQAIERGCPSCHLSRSPPPPSGGPAVLAVAEQTPWLASPLRHTRCA